MDLYFTPLSCSIASRIALYEARVDARFVLVERKTKRLPDGASFLDVSPLGMVPVLRTDDAQLLTENTAILQYIAERHPEAALAPTGGFARSQLQQWLAFIATELHKNVFVPLLAADASDEVKAYALAKHRLRFDFLERHLQARSFLLDEFSVADALLVAVLNWARVTPVKLEQWPAVQAYHARLLQRPSIARAVNEEFALYQRER